MEKLYKLLSDTQASLFVLFQKTWVYHWHVVGPDFKQIHDLFGEQYVALQEEVDRIAEHMRFLEIKPVSSLSRVVEVSGIGEAKSNISEMEMIRDLMDGHQKIITMLSDAAMEADEQKSRGTVNLLDDLNEAHGKFVWMLRSFTEK
jgi:starvation-inducible DNA-binding protein